MNGLGFRDFVGERIATYPARLPLAQLDFVYSRGLKPVGIEVPKGRIWWRMSDHLPLIAEFKL
jgi:endonuclease/exonuclease/phosphatase family metal-dependent hydrolase